MGAMTIVCRYLFISLGEMMTQGRVFLILLPRGRSRLPARSRIDSTPFVHLFIIKNIIHEQLIISLLIHLFKSGLPAFSWCSRWFQDDVFLQLFEVAEIANFTQDEQESYQSSLKYYRDLNNVIDTFWLEGKAEGKAERSAEIARPLLGKLPVETISETTGLSVEAIEKLSQ